MRNDPDVPDRRPLVYGLVGLVILVAAAYLFWPRGGGDTDVGPMVLVPGTAADSEDSAAADETLADAGRAAPESAPDQLSALDDALSTEAAARDPIEEAARITSATQVTEEVPEEPLARGETRIVDARPERRDAKVTSSGTRIEANGPSTRPLSGAPSNPSSSGRFVLNVGSFGTRANADRQAQALHAKGWPTHVHVATTDDGATVYRVRIGYFDSRAAAEEFGGWLKRSQSLESWVSSR